MEKKLIFKRKKIRVDEVGLQFKDGQFEKKLAPGKHFIRPFTKRKIEIVSLRNPVFTHPRMREILKSDELKGVGMALDLRDWQRALVWVDGRFKVILSPGLYFVWEEFHDVRVEVKDARAVRFDHEELPVISRIDATSHLDITTVEREHVGVLYVDGKHRENLSPGRYAFWRQVAEVDVEMVDLREQAIEINGQELMTSDKVTLRLNAVVTFQVADALRSVSCSDDIHLALYRASQLALRAIVGQHELDEFLDDKEQVAEKAEERLRGRAEELGLKLVSVGVRDVILPGEMKDLMNKVIEARKAAEADVIARREETSAIRSQANTAKLLDQNPTLMRLRELEVLEKVAESSNLQVVLGDKDGLTDRIRRMV